METNAKYRLMQNAQQEAAGRGNQFLNRNMERPTVPEIEELKPASAGYRPPTAEDDDRDGSTENPPEPRD
jgi:hypothetical protein